MSRYALIGRSTTSAVHGHDGIAALDFRLEVDGIAVGNNPALLAGQGWYVPIAIGGAPLELPGRLEIPHGAWAAPRGILAEYPELAAELIRALSSELGRIMQSLDRVQTGEAWPEMSLRLETDGPSPPWS